MEPVKLELIPVSIVCRVKNTGGVIEIPVTEENKTIVMHFAIAIWDSFKELPKLPGREPK